MSTAEHTFTELENGLELTLKEEITSIPYIKMTLSLLNEIGVKTTFVGNKIKVCEKFEGETENLVFLQQMGWQAILDNF